MVKKPPIYLRRFSGYANSRWFLNHLEQRLHTSQFQTSNKLDGTIRGHVVGSYEAHHSPLSSFLWLFLTRLKANARFAAPFFPRGVNSFFSSRLL